MNCTQYQNMLDDYLDGTLSTIQLNNLHIHLNKCENCSNEFSQAEEILVSLKNIPVPPAKKGYEQRMLKFLEEKHIQKNPQRNWFMAGFGSAVAATFAMWLYFSPVATPDLEEVSTVNLTVQQTHKVDLVFNLPNALQDATLSLELPEKIEIAGYPGKRQLKWKTSFKKGANRLALPLIATEEHDGILTASLSKNGITKTFHINIDSQLPSTSSGFIQDDMAKAT